MTGDELPCPQCRQPLRTRVLADAVTLIAVGSCPLHGTVECSRVQLVQPTPSIDAEPQERELVDVPLSYKADRGRCGRRLSQDTWCQLPPGHASRHS